MNKIIAYIKLHILLPIAELLIGTNATYWYKQITKMADWSTEEITKWQQKRLQLFISHAYNHTTYYHKLFDDLGISPKDIQNTTDLKKIPILTKEIVNAHYDEFIPDNLSHFKYRKGKTGGTTGEPMLYLCDENTWGYVTAAKIYYWQKAGWRYGEKFAAFGSASLFGKKPSFTRRIYDIIRNEIPMNSINLDDKLCCEYLKIIQKKHIHFIYGYAASIFLLAQYAKNHGIHVPNIKVIFTTSENLPDTYRKAIEETFSCHVIDCYGARDGGITAYETTYHKYNVGYNVILELCDKTNEQSGTALTTNFLNMAFPLIRYQFGDIVSIDNNSQNSYNGITITKIWGRTSDVMRLQNGHNLSSAGISVIMKAFNIIAFDVNMIDNNTIKIRIQPIKHLYTHLEEEQIQHAIHKYIGEDCNLIIEYVSHFTELPNGKRRYFMNDISQKIDSCRL